MCPSGCEMGLSEKRKTNWQISFSDIAKKVTMKSDQAGKTSNAGVCWWSMGPGPAAGPSNSGGFVQDTLQAAGRSADAPRSAPALGAAGRLGSPSTPLFLAPKPGGQCFCESLFLTVQWRPGVTTRNYIRSHRGVHLILLQPFYFLSNLQISI